MVEKAPSSTEAGGGLAPCRRRRRVGWGDASRGLRRHVPVVVVSNDSWQTAGASHPGRQRMPGELYVTSSGPTFTQWAQVSHEATAEIRQLFATLDPPELRTLTTAGCTRCSPAWRPAGGDRALMPQGSLLTIRLGAWSTGRPHGERSSSRQDPATTHLRGYFSTNWCSDPLALPGRQDSPPTWIAPPSPHGRQAGFETVLFTTMAPSCARRVDRNSVARRTQGRHHVRPGTGPPRSRPTCHRLRTCWTTRSGSSFKLMLQGESNVRRGAATPESFTQAAE
jgi:hypothetical protein